MEKKTIYVVIGLLLVVLIIVQIVVFYMRRKKTKVIPDSGSIQRIQTLNQLFRSYLGINWPVVLSLIVILIVIILIIMYFITKKDISINIESNKWLNRTMIVFFVVVTVATIAAVFNIYRSGRVSSDELTEDEKILQKRKGDIIKVFAGIIFLIFLMLVSAGLFIGYKRRT